MGQKKSTRIGAGGRKSAWGHGVLPAGTQARLLDGKLRRFGRKPVRLCIPLPIFTSWENIGRGSENTQGCEASFLPKHRISLDIIPLNNLIIDKICLNVNGVNAIRV